MRYSAGPGIHSKELLRNTKVESSCDCSSYEMEFEVLREVGKISSGVKTQTPGEKTSACSLSLLVAS